MSSEQTNERDELAEVLREQGVDDLHSWRCREPNIYGECSCVTEFADAIIAAGWQKTDADVIREAQAQALEEAADQFYARLPDGTGNGRAYNSYTVARTLRDRAAAYRVGEGE